MTSPSPHSSRFFRALGKIETEGSSAFLDSRQVEMRENKICGFIEIQIAPSMQALLLFAPGILAGTYLLEDENSKPFQMMNLSTVWDGKPAPIRVVELPQTAGRMMWLALESPISGKMEIAEQTTFEKQLNLWKSESFSGTVEWMTEKGQGISYIHEGSALDTESFFYDGEVFEEKSVALAKTPIQIILHKPAPASQAHQCLTLRQGILRWGNATLRRYQEMVGQKLIRMMRQDIEEIASPWGWDISIEDATLQDRHFFSYVQTAAQSYRAILMETGAQMDQVVGSALTQRVLSDTFNQLSKDARAALELHRLIPAAFSE